MQKRIFLYATIALLSCAAVLARAADYLPAGTTDYFKAMGASHTVPVGCGYGPIQSVKIVPKSHPDASGSNSGNAFWGDWVKVHYEDGSTQKFPLHECIFWASVYGPNGIELTLDRDTCVQSVEILGACQKRYRPHACKSAVAAVYVLPR